MTRRLYVDIDSCIYPAEDLYDAAALELFGKPFGLKESDHYFIPDEMRARFGPDYARIFDLALAPERVHERELYTGVERALFDIWYRLEMDITFISYNHKPGPLREPVREWLESRLAFPFDLTIYGHRNDKTATMTADPSAWGIVEDSPKTLLKSARKGFATFGIHQAWNENLTTDPNCGIMWFDEWEKLPDLVERALGLVTNG